MHPDLQDIIVTEADIRARVAELGKQIAADYAGKQLLVVGILKGAAIFAADLVRAIDLPVEVDFMAISSYGTSTVSTGVHRILKDLDDPIEGKHVLLVEDVVDTGLTLRYLKEYLEQRKPASLKVCSFLDKPSRRTVEIEAEYVGFQVPDVFVVGYGLDYSQQYRNLPYVGALKPEVYTK